MSSRKEIQAPAVNRRRVGDLTVTMLSDGYLDVSFELLSGITGAQAETLLASRGTAAIPRMNINAYVIESGERTILVDSGAGGINGWGGRLQVALAAAGFDPLDIDTVLLTHAHPDHVGGLAGPLQTPIFRNVEQFYVNAKELEFWRSDLVYSNAPDGFKPFFDVARNAFAAYDDRLVPFRSESLLPGIQAVELAGHTPGHTGYLIGEGESALLIWGDIVHFPHVQMAQPEVTIAFDSDPSQAASTRRKLLERIVSENLRVTGMHFNAPVSGVVSRAGSSFVLDYDLWSPAP